MMSPYSDAELVAMAADLESELVERKESLRGNTPAKARQAICAFANDLPGHGRPGALFIGLRDDGSPSGFPVTDDALLQLAAMKTDGNILPPPTMSVRKVSVAGNAVAVVLVWPSDSPPVRVAGTIWIRVGPRRGVATVQDEHILNDRRRSGDPPYDLHPAPGAKLDDLSRGRFEDYLRLAVDPDVLARNDRTYAERLAAAKMIRSIYDTTPTVTGVLVLARRPERFVPGAYIQFLRVDGVEWGGSVVDEARCFGPLEEALRDLRFHLRAHNRTRVDITSGPVETRSSTYPLPALEQLVNNAVMHRLYEGSNAPVRAYWFDDRIEIISPGGPYGAVSPESLGQPGVVDYRNPNVAEAMRVLGLVQRFGFGFEIVHRELRQNGNPELELQADASHVACVVRRRPE